VRAMLAACNANTIGLVCSAPCYPQGVVDPVADLAAGASARGLPLHVDCCLGSFLIACAGEAGRVLPPFDFAVPGVVSISADTHKFGFAPKGSSVIMYAEHRWRTAQYFVCPEWTGGIYASPTIAGSRPGALIAGCWATMVHVGKAGYVAAARRILGGAEAMAAAVRAIPDLQLFGEPDLCVVCFGARPGAPGGAISVYAVNDAMSARGWNLNVLQYPACLHICVTHANAGHADAFAADLAAAVAEVRGAPAGRYTGGSAAIYGMAEALPDKAVVADVATYFLDALYVTA